MNPTNPKAQGHTAGKLHVHGEFVRGENGYVIVRMVDGRQQANALELVRRWNRHEELLEALGYYATGSQDGGKWARTAIANATT